MHIPTDEEQPSMNLGQAVAICLYELVRCKPDSLPTERPLPASAGEMERVTTVLLDVLHTSGYMDLHPSDEKEQAVRRMVRRLSLSSEDSALWLGMLRQIAWKLRTKNL
jgi:tRNA/rRNA methyltransferase